MSEAVVTISRSLVCGVLILAAVRPALADYPSALVFDTGYATGPAQWTPWTNLPNLEDSLWIFGTVSDVNAPFEDLVPPGPHELTYVFESYACFWAAHGGDQTCSFTEFAFFDLGRIRVYLDLSPDADFADPATFRDGQLVLTANAFPLQLYTENHCVTGIRYVQQAFMTFLGGAWFSRVSQNGVGFVAGNIGEFRGDIPPALAALGYIGQSNSFIDIIVPNATVPTTWGRIKALYR
jgi:hypothetical protein